MGREKLLGVQYLRAIAALMVAYFHLTLQIPAYTAALAAHRVIDTRYFTGAVPVFFVISGFVMYVSGIDGSPGKFALRRLARIVPLYWFLTAAIIALAVLKPGFLHHTSLAPAHIAASFLFVPAGFPILVPGWSLNYEMAFYAIFALALFAPRPMRLAAMLIGIGVLSLAGTRYASGLLALFAAGLILGRFYRLGKIRLPRWMATAMILGGSYALIGTACPEWVRSDIAPASIVLGVISFDTAGLTPSWPWLLALGDASYSIYLVHPFAFDIVAKVWRGHNALLFAAVSLALAIVMALCTYRLIEKPASAILTKRRSAAGFAGSVAARCYVREGRA